MMTDDEFEEFSAAWCGASLTIGAENRLDEDAVIMAFESLKDDYSIPQVKYALNQIVRDTKHRYWLITPADIIRKQACLRPRERFWDIPVPKIDSAFDNLLVPQPSWSPSTTQQLRKLVAAPYLAPNDWTPRSEAYFVFPLAQGTPGKQCGLAATGVYQPSLRSPWLAAIDGETPSADKFIGLARAKNTPLGIVAFTIVGGDIDRQDAYYLRQRGEELVIRYEADLKPRLLRGEYTDHELRLMIKYQVDPCAPICDTILPPRRNSRLLQRIEAIKNPDKCLGDATNRALPAPPSKSQSPLSRSTH